MTEPRPRKTDPTGTSFPWGPLPADLRGLDREMAQGLGFPSLTDAEFSRLRDWVEKESGIHLTDAKRGLVMGRLAKRVRAVGATGFGAYIERALGSAGPEERARLLDALCTNETHFFREIHHFDFLEKRVFPSWRVTGTTGRIPRHIRAWSAACSTGEEPYTLAMVLLKNFPRSSGWSVEVLGTDLSGHALQRAAAAVWPIEKAAEIPSAFLKSFMRRGTGPEEGKMKAGPEIREAVHFLRLNLCAEVYPVSGAFDLIFCRNVLIYFNWDTKRKVIGRLLSHLAPTGYFFSGHAESLNELSNVVTTLQPTVYRPLRTADSTDPTREAP